MRFALCAVLAIAAVLAVPPWAFALWGSMPRRVAREVAIRFLWSLLVAYGVTLTATLIGIPILARAVIRSRRRRQRQPATARLLLLGVSTLFSLALLEGATAAWQAWVHRLPEAPARLAVEPNGTENLPTRFAGDKGGAISIVVIGESSARGEPYHPNLSVGQILGWQLEKVFPDRAIRVEMRAEAGLHMELAVSKLNQLEHRPAAVLIYCGHNEFQTHYGWRRVAPFYVEEVTRGRRVAFREFLGKLSPVCGMIGELLDRQTVDAPPPPPAKNRRVVDSPVCSPSEYAERLRDFGRRLEAAVVYCEKVGALPLLVIPAGNDADFEPSRSVVEWTTPKPEREAFARDFRAIRGLEASDPAKAEAAYRDLLRRQPCFAEAHYRLAKVLEADGRWEEANAQYIRARDLDALPMRCPTVFQQAYREVAWRHGCAIVVDAQKVLSASSPRGILGEHQFHDGQHPTLLSYIALTQDLLSQLRARKAFGWPEGAAVPTIDAAECAKHFVVDRKKWAQVCHRSANFYSRTANMRYDTSDRRAKAKRYEEAEEAIASGTPPEETGVPGLGCRPTFSRAEGAPRKSQSAARTSLVGISRVPTSKHSTASKIAYPP